MASGPRRRSEDRGRRSGGERAGRRLGARLRGGHRKKLGSSTRTRRTRCGRRTGTKWSCTPVIFEDKVYIARPGPGARRGVGHLYCIDANQAGDITQSAACGTSTRSGDPSRRRPSRRPALHPRFQRVPALLDAKTVRSTGRTTSSPQSGLDAGCRRQGVPRRRRWRHSSSCRRARRKKCWPRMNMGSAVYATGAGSRRAVHQQPQPALRVGGRRNKNATQTRRHKNTHLFRVFVPSCLRVALALCLASLSRAGFLRQLGSISRQCAPDRVTASAPPVALTVRWTYDAASRSSRRRPSSTAPCTLGSSKGELLALDLETCKLRWKYATGEAGSSASRRRRSATASCRR